ncbi:MAG: sulfite oxidase [Gemmataceae bacterium]|nr:sulfite oxidase [Gemmataceae bacterium]
MSPSRRDLLRAAAASPLAAGRAAAAEDPSDPRTAGLIVRMREPRNLETPPDGLLGWRTPADRFYVRSHFAVPKVDPGAYRLAVTGHVEKPLSLSLEELRRLPQVTKPLTLECAGNGRVFLTPAVQGLQWGVGAVGTADWTGVPLGAVLDRAGVKTGATEVILVGADSGTVAGPPPSPGPIHFDRSLPLAKARRDEVLLASGMNDRPLTAAHGAPVRAVVGGWYGMASVKWLTGVIVTDRPHAGFWQTIDYSYFGRADGLPTLRPVTEMLPKAVVARAGVGWWGGDPPVQRFGAAGQAWAGEANVAKVEVSVDGGRTWAAAKLGEQARPFCWRGWSHAWQDPAPRGVVEVLARCTDDRGRTQPDRRDPDRRTYMINHLVPTEVTVR